MKWFWFEECTRNVLLGQSWGDKRQYFMQREAIAFSDPREKRARHPHPLISSIVPLDVLQAQSESDRWIGCGKWRPTSMKKAGYDTTIFKWLQLGTRNLYQIELIEDQCTIFEVPKLILRKPDDGSDHLLLAHSGDDIAILAEGLTAYCRIYKSFVVRFNGRMFGWLFPFWYNTKGNSHRWTHNQLVTRAPIFYRPNALCPPVAWTNVMQQVLIVHSCSEACVVKCLKHDDQKCSRDDCKHPSSHKVITIKMLSYGKS